MHQNIQPSLLYTHTETHTGLIQQLCGRPSYVACKHKRDERTADENAPSELAELRSAQLLDAAQNDLGSDERLQQQRAAEEHPLYMDTHSHTPAASSHKLPYLIIEKCPSALSMVRADLLSAKKMCGKSRS